jgi:hypothetical protein
MLYLQRKKTGRLKTIVLGLLLCLSASSYAQRELNLEDHDFKAYYFGISSSNLFVTGYDHDR